MNNHAETKKKLEVRDSLIWSHLAARWITEHTWRIEMKQKWIGVALIALIGLMSLSRPAHAQSASVTASWFAVITDTSGATLPPGALLGYNLYYSLNQSDLSSTAQPPVVGAGATKVPVSPSNTSASVNVLAGQTYYFAVTAYDSTGESGFSNIASTSPATTSAFNYDVNGDGVVNIADVQATVNQIIGLAPCTTGDVNKDTFCTVADAQLVVNKILGLIQ